MEATLKEGSVYPSMGVEPIGGLNGVTVVASNFIYNYIIGRVAVYCSNH